MPRSVFYFFHDYIAIGVLDEITNRKTAPYSGIAVLAYDMRSIAVRLPGWLGIRGKSGSERSRQYAAEADGTTVHLTEDTGDDGDKTDSSGRDQISHLSGENKDSGNASAGEEQDSSDAGNEVIVG